MEYNKLASLVDQLDGHLATIKLRSDPSREFLAQIEYCSNGYVYLFWVDKRTVSAYAETMTRVNADDVISLEQSDILDSDVSTAYLGDDWKTALNDPDVFPQDSSE